MAYREPTYSVSQPMNFRPTFNLGFHTDEQGDFITDPVREVLDPGGFSAPRMTRDPNIGNLGISPGDVVSPVRSSYAPSQSIGMPGSNSSLTDLHKTVHAARGMTRVPGQGSGKVDKVPAMLAPGEAVLNKGAADKMGRGMIAKANAAGVQRMGMAGR